MNTKKRIREVRPCDFCGDPGGKPSKGCTTGLAARRTVSRPDGEGEACERCHDSIRKRGQPFTTIPALVAWRLAAVKRRPSYRVSSVKPDKAPAVKVARDTTPWTPEHAEETRAEIREAVGFTRTEARPWLDRKPERWDREGMDHREFVKAILRRPRRPP